MPEVALELENTAKNSRKSTQSGIETANHIASSWGSKYQTKIFRQRDSFCGFRYFSYHLAKNIQTVDLALVRGVFQSWSQFLASVRLSRSRFVARSAFVLVILQNDGNSKKSNHIPKRWIRISYKTSATGYNLKLDGDITFRAGFFLAMKKASTVRNLVMFCLPSRIFDIILIVASAFLEMVMLKP